MKSVIFYSSAATVVYIIFVATGNDAFPACIPFGVIITLAALYAIARKFGGQ